MPGFFESLTKLGFIIDIPKAIHELRDQGFTAFRYEEVIVDLLRPVIPAYSHVLDGAVEAKILGQTVRISSPEGLIVMKLIAMRPQDQADIQELLAAYSGKLDLDFVRKELDSFSDANDSRREKFEAWVREQTQKNQD